MKQRLLKMVAFTAAVVGFATSARAQVVRVNSPYQNVYEAGAPTAGFGPDVTTATWTGNVVLINDGTAAPTLGCAAAGSNYANRAAVTGNIAMIDRGNCTFVSKIELAEFNGAVGAIICNNAATGVVNSYGGTSSSTIPHVMLSKPDCNEIKAALQSGATVNVTFGNVVINYDVRTIRDLTIGPRHGSVPASEIVDAANDYVILPAQRVWNKGAMDATNIECHFKLLADGDSVSGYDLFDSLPLLAAGDTSGLISDNGGIGLPAVPTRYRMVYSAKAAEADEIPGNNANTHDFSVSEETFSQTNVDDNGYPAINRYTTIQTGADTAGIWEYGPMFYVRHGAGHQFNTVYFSLAHSNPAMFVGKEVTIKVKKVIADFSTTNLSDAAFQLEQDYPYILTQADFDNTYIEVPIMHDLADNTVYWVSVEYLEGTAIAVATEFAVADYDLYAANLALLSGTAGVSMLNGAMKVTTFANTTNWYTGFASANLSLSVSVDQTLGAKNVISAKEIGMTLMPNPANNQMNMLLKLKDKSSVVATISDLSGKVIETQSFDDVLNRSIGFNTAKLANGTYLMTVKTNQGIATKKFVVAH